MTLACGIIRGMFRRAAAVVPLALVLAGCSSPPTAVSYGSIDALRSAVVSAGVPCERWHANPAGWTESFGVKDIAMTGQCNDEEPSVYLTWYRDLAYIDEAKSRQSAGQDDGVLWGPDWSVRADAGTIKRLQRAIGGEKLG